MAREKNAGVPELRDLVGGRREPMEGVDREGRAEQRLSAIPAANMNVSG